jgi:hypothetical protein
VLVRNDSPSVSRSAQSELDRRAIRVVGHLLTTGIWLEHQLRTPTPPTGLVWGSGWVRSPLRWLSSGDVQFTQPTWKQPSRTAAIAVLGR